MDGKKDFSPNNKKKITVRKVENATNMGTSEERSIPIAEDDSKFDIGVFQNHQLSSEDEVQIIDLDSEEPQAIILLFPDLQSEGLNFEELNRTVSTAALTKMLVGKHADFSMLKPCKKLTFPCIHAKLSPIREESFEDQPLPMISSNERGAKPKQRPHLDSLDADDELDD